MPKIVDRYVCQECGAVTPKWAGKCTECGAWNSIVQEQQDKAPPGSMGITGGSASGSNVTRLQRPAGGAASAQIIDLVAIRGSERQPERMVSGLGEFDRICGGGLVPASALLIGGDPGIGKSTLLLQICANLARAGRRVAYITGEESIAQVRMRATRLDLEGADIMLAAETCLRDILHTLSSLASPPDLVIIDSIQTMWTDLLAASPGTVGQVRASAQELIRFAKSSGAAMLMVGHVTKDGQIAGPRVIEHMADTVLYFEGERGDQYRILRAIKNRFGATNEIGIFHMSGVGLAEVQNPSELFLNSRGHNVSGSAVFAGIEGSRPVLVEIQALVAPSSLGTPRRAVVGWDSARLSMVLAVLEARCGLSLAQNDIYLNVAGGLRITEPAADLAVAAALVSSAFDRPLSEDPVIFGEVSLSGAVRPVQQAETRLREAEKLGFQSAILSAANAQAKKTGLRAAEIALLSELVDRLRPQQ